MSIYDFKVKAQDGSEVSLSEYKGKALLIVNTATECGFTPQYEELEAIWREYSERGLVILDFPCNQFGNQAPGSDAEIGEFCTVRYNTTFPRFAKLEVKGENASPLFAWLCENAGFAGFDKNPAVLMLSGVLKKLDPEYKSNDSVKWNFTKFLIDRDGNVCARFEPMTALKKVRAKIEEVL